MSYQENFMFFVDQLLDCAVDSFRHTQQYELLQEKLVRMDEDCDSMLKPELKEFVVGCFELLLDKAGQQEYYVYNCGIKDGIRILKSLGVLS